MNDALNALFEGDDVLDANGQHAGRIEAVWVDPLSDLPAWALVGIGGFPARRVVVPVDAGLLSAGAVRLPFPRELIRSAPRGSDDDELSEEIEEQARAHFGLPSAVGDGWRAAEVTAQPITWQPPQGGDGHAAPPPAIAPSPAVVAAPVGQTPPSAAPPMPPPTPVPAVAAGAAVATASAAPVELLEERPEARAVPWPAAVVTVRKEVVAEPVTLHVRLRREELRVEREPITDPAAVPGPHRIAAVEHRLTLMREEAVVEHRTVPVERVRISAEEHVEERELSAEVRRERLPGAVVPR